MGAQRLCGLGRGLQALWRCRGSITLHNALGSTSALSLCFDVLITGAGLQSDRGNQGLHSCCPYCHNQFHTNITDNPVWLSPEGSALGIFGFVSDDAEQGWEEVQQRRQSSRTGTQLSLTCSEHGLSVTTSCIPCWKLDRSKPDLDLIPRGINMKFVEVISSWVFISSGADVGNHKDFQSGSSSWKCGIFRSFQTPETQICLAWLQEMFVLCSLMTSERFHLILNSTFIINKKMQQSLFYRRNWGMAQLWLTAHCARKAGLGSLLSLD